MASRKSPPGLPTRVSTGVSASLTRFTEPWPPPPLLPPPEVVLLLPQAEAAIKVTKAAAIAGFFPRSIVILPIARTRVVTHGPARHGQQQRTSRLLQSNARN